MTIPHVPRPWPLAPLLAYLRLTPWGFADRYGIRPADVRYARDHGLTDDQADAWTIAADLHPCLIWPDWLTAPADDIDGQDDEVWGEAA